MKGEGHSRLVDMRNEFTKPENSSAFFLLNVNFNNKYIIQTSNQQGKKEWL